MLQNQCATKLCFSCIFSDNQGLCILHLFCELEMALNRNAARSVGRVEEAVIRAMGERFEPPDSGKRTWEKHSLTLDTCTAIDL